MGSDNQDRTTKIGAISGMCKLRSVLLSKNVRYKTDSKYCMHTLFDRQDKRRGVPQKDQKKRSIELNREAKEKMERAKAKVNWNAVKLYAYIFPLVTGTYSTILFIVVT